MFSGMNYVYEVYKERSFSKAAENLYITQPALSSMIKKVEAKVGMPLFDRTTNPIQLTECGKKYIKTAEKIMDLEDEFAYYVGKLNELKTGNLGLGGSYLYSSYILPPIITQFQKKYPHVKISLFEGHTSLLEKKLFAGELDIILDNYLLDESIYEKRFFMEEHLLLAVPASYSSNQRVTKYRLSVEDVRKNVHLQPNFPGVPLKKFRDDPFVVLRSHNDTRERVEDICRRAGLELNITLKLNQLLTTYHLTEYEMGNSFVSDTVVKNLPPNTNINYYKINDPDAIRKVFLYYRKNKYLTRSMAEFMKLALPDENRDTE